MKEDFKTEIFLPTKLVICRERIVSFEERIENRIKGGKKDERILYCWIGCRRDCPFGRARNFCEVDQCACVNGFGYMLVAGYPFLKKEAEMKLLGIAVLGLIAIVAFKWLFDWIGSDKEGEE